MSSVTVHVAPGLFDLVASGMSKTARGVACNMDELRHVSLLRADNPVPKFASSTKNSLRF